MTGAVQRGGKGVTPQQLRERLMELAARPQGTTTEEVADALRVSRGRLTWYVQRAVATGALFDADRIDGVLEPADSPKRYFTTAAARDAWLAGQEAVDGPVAGGEGGAADALELPLIGGHTPAALTAQRTRFESQACATSRPPVMRPGALDFKTCQRPGRF